MSPRRPAGGITVIVLIAFLAIGISRPPPAAAGLVIEPVHNRVPGSGQADNNFPIYDPTFLINGVAYFLTDEPGETVTYASGDPRDPDLDVFHVWNNTQYNITGFILRIVGTATDTRDPGTVVRGPVDAVFGDVDGDGQAGESDIFDTITVSDDGKEIRFSDGLIPLGGRFTDLHFARSDDPPQFAGVEAQFTGEFVPLPAPLLAAIPGLLMAGACARRAVKPRRG